MVRPTTHGIDTPMKKLAERFQMFVSPSPWLTKKDITRRVRPERLPRRLAVVCGKGEREEEEREGGEVGRLMVKSGNGGLNVASLPRAILNFTHPTSEI